MSKGIPLVTGATGFAGRHLVAHLLESYPEVAAWRNPTTNRLLSSDDRRILWSAVDVTNVDQVAKALTELPPNAIFHCAGIADVHSSWSASARALRVNVMGTHAVLEALRRVGLHVPIMITGSALVYRPSSSALTEDSPLAPSNPYGVSKLAQEMRAAAAAGHVIITRPFNHAGPGQSEAYVTSSFARQIAEAEAGLREPVLRVGNLESRRDITDVRDTVRAYQLLVDGGVPHRPYNVCQGEAYRIGDLLEKLVRLSRVSITVETDPARLRPSDIPILLGSPERIRIDTGWKPEFAIDRTLADLLDYWRQALNQRGTPH